MPGSDVSYRPACTSINARHGLDRAWSQDCSVSAALNLTRRYLACWDLFRCVRAIIPPHVRPRLRPPAPLFQCQREALLRNPTGMGPQHLGPLLRSRLNSVGTLDAAVHGLIGDCLESQPSQRPSMQQVLERLEGVADKALQRPGPKQAPRRKPQQGQQQGAGVDQNVRKDVDKGKKGKKGKRS